MEQSITEQVLAKAALDAVAQTEKKIDAEIAALDLNTEDGLERARRSRLAELKKRAADEARWRSLGHGSYTEIGDQKDWFEACKNSERVICHFYRPSTWRCEIIDKHLQVLAPRHIETRFIKINAESAPYLAEKLSVVLLPTLIGMKNNFTHDRIEGFDEFGGIDNFPLQVLEERLARTALIDISEEQLAKSRAGAGMSKVPHRSTTTKSNPLGKAIYANRRRYANDSEEEDSDDAN